MNRHPELLIPASSLEVLKTAVVFGADAVYIGGEAFGLRAKAKNFSREDMAEGCTEKLDLEFVLWILRDGRAPARRSRFRALLRCYPDKVVVCKNNRDVSRFISSVSQ